MADPTTSGHLEKLVKFQKTKNFYGNGRVRLARRDSENPRYKLKKKYWMAASELREKLILFTIPVFNRVKVSGIQQR